MQKTDEINELIKAKIAFQKEVKAITKDKKVAYKQVKYSYVTLDAILETINPLLSKNDLTIMQEVTNDGVKTWLFHSSGQFISTENLKIDIDVPTGLGNQSLAQLMGGTITYAKRYQISALLGISTDEDNDAAPVKREEKKEDTLLKELSSLVNSNEVIFNDEEKKDIRREWANAKSDLEKHQVITYVKMSTKQKLENDQDFEESVRPKC